MIDSLITIKPVEEGRAVVTFPYHALNYVLWVKNEIGNITKCMVFIIERNASFLLYEEETKKLAERLGVNINAL